jgi:transketolase
MRDTFVKTLLAEAKVDPNVVLITGDLGFGVLEEFEKELPSQFINSGVAEQSMIGLASGIASTGKRVFVYSIGNFPTIRALEQIRNDVCYMNNPVVIVAVGSGYSYGSQGYTHHALEDIAAMRALPNMNVVSPADPVETEVLTRFLVKDRSPSYLRLGRSGEKVLNRNIPDIVEGRFNRIFSGEDGVILFTGSIGGNVIAARETLMSRGIEISIYSVPFISKISEIDLQALDNTKPIVVVEEHTIRGGLTSAVLEEIALSRLEMRIIPVTAKQNNLGNIGNQSYLRDINGLGVDLIASYFLER